MSTRFQLSGNDPAKYAPFMDELTPLQQAIMQPPHNAGRIDMAALIEAEEKASGYRRIS